MLPKTIKTLYDQVANLCKKTVFFRKNYCGAPGGPKSTIFGKIGLSKGPVYLKKCCITFLWGWKCSPFCLNNLMLDKYMVALEWITDGKENLEVYFVWQF